MRKDVTEDSAAIADVLDRAEFMTLALADADGLHSVPLNFAQADGVVYFHTGRKGRKTAALRQAEAEGRAVAFSAVVDIAPKTGELACQWGRTFRSVFGSGRVRFLEDPAERLAGLGVIMKKYAGADSFPYDERILAKTLVAAIRIERATARLKLT
jgi:nitroimidazol reductase NimA-like FMN-containing flavoprotein (pyridoxamine 5'-phosphate oxidase superfamily)